MSAFLYWEKNNERGTFQLKVFFLPAGIDFSVYNAFTKSRFSCLITASSFSTIRMERRGNQIGFNRKDKQKLD
ncbi:hypothetical protein EYH65_07960 [Bacillus subtilis]|nr:hypothetical protein [Bacillus subtilis]